jgi:hypothetical protein
MATPPLFPSDEAWDAFITHELLTGNGSEWRLAERLSSGEFNAEAKREIVSRLLTDEQMPGRAAFVLADDPGSAAPDLMEPRQSLGDGSRGQQVVDDQAAIAGVVDAAFREEEIKAADLVALASRFEAGEERVASLLGRHQSGTGGAAEAFALALIEEHYPQAARSEPPDLDNPEVLNGLGVAYSLIANDSALREAHFGGESPAHDPRTAFETLVRFNDANPYGPTESLLRSETAANGLTAATALFDDHSESLLNHYTGGGNGEIGDEFGIRDPSPLVHFLAQASINPYARDLTVDSGETLHGAITSDVGEFVDRRIEVMTDGDTSLRRVHNLNTQLAALQASAGMARDLEFTRYETAIGNREEWIKWFEGAGAEIVGAGPASEVPVLGTALERSGEFIGRSVGEALAEAPPLAPLPGTGDEGSISWRLNDVERALEAQGRDGESGDLHGPYLGTVNDLRGAIVGDQQRADVVAEPPTTAFASLTSPDHPDSARYTASLRGCEGCRLPIDDTELTNLASTVALRSREAGLPSVDHVVASPNGERVFAVAGRLDDPAHLRISVPVEEARGRTVETNSREWAELERTRTAEMTLDVELAQRSAMRMA